MQIYLQGQPQPTDGTHRPDSQRLSTLVRGGGGWGFGPGTPELGRGGRMWSWRGDGARSNPLQPHYTPWTPNCSPLSTAGGAQAVPPVTVPPHRWAGRVRGVFLGAQTPRPCPRGTRRPAQRAPGAGPGATANCSREGGVPHSEGAPPSSLGCPETPPPGPPSPAPVLAFSSSFKTIVNPESRAP